MNDFDQAARFVAEMDPQGTLDRLLDGSGLHLAFIRWFPANTIPRLKSPEREADSIAECADVGKPGRRWLVVIEWQSRPERGKLRTLLEEAANFASRAKWGDGQEYMVMPAMAHLTGEADPRLLDMPAPGGQGVLCTPLQWDIAKDDAAKELERIAAGERSWSVLAWVPLMAGADSDIIVARWLEVLEARVADERVRRGVRGVALILAQLALNQPTWARGLKEESVMGESNIMNAMRKVIADAARLETLRKCVIDSVDARFPGQMPPEVRQLIGGLESPQLLDAWFQTALRAGSYGEFDAVVRQ